MKSCSSTAHWLARPPGCFFVASILACVGTAKPYLKERHVSHRIAITGATGLIGKALTRALIARGDTVVAFSRTPSAPSTLPVGVTPALWNPQDTHATAAALTGCDTIVNLVGASIAGTRWTNAYKHILWQSRVPATQYLVSACATMTTPPARLISSSGSGYYGFRAARYDVDEDSSPGSDYLAQLCVAWEAAAMDAEQFGMRVAVVRTSVVLDNIDGALPLMALPFRLWVGGHVGSGTQPIAWIHRDDLITLLLWLIDHPDAQGAYNAVAPQPVDNLAFSAALAATLHRPNWLPIPAFALRLLFGEMADALLLNGQTMHSNRLNPDTVGYTHTTLVPALTQLWKER
jgi:uncharacterized protein (TIGR01777 family)